LELGKGKFVNKKNVFIMKNRIIVGMVATSLAFASCTKSDKEYEKALVGNWRLDTCPFYYNDDYDELDFYWFISIEFQDNGTVSESRPIFFCKDSCFTDTSIGGVQVEHCTCRFYVEDGHLIIEPDGDNVQGHYTNTDFPYNTKIPIVKVTDSQIVFDELVVGQRTTRCTCLERLD
jgi:hypothetical protein